MVAPVPLEYPPCPTCGGLAHVTLMSGARDFIWGKPGEFEIQRCATCGLAATRPRPVEDALGFYYDNAYSGEGEDAMRRVQTEAWVFRLANRYRLAVLAKVRRLDSADHLLDVGCSYGGFLRVARQTHGCRVSGIDIDAGSIARAVDRDVTHYRRGKLTEADYEPGSFTAITFWQSLEHHPDPVLTLRKARDLLTPGGVCLVEVPNFGGFWRRVFRTSWLPLLVPQHLYHFTPRTLRGAFEAAGFEPVVHQQTMFYPLEGIASLGIWLSRLLHLPRPEAQRWWQKPIGLALGVLLCALYPLAEIPSQALLRLLGLAGHHVAIARKPYRSV